MRRRIRKRRRIGVRQGGSLKEEEDDDEDLMVLLCGMETSASDEERETGVGGVKLVDDGNRIFGLNEAVLGTDLPSYEGLTI